MNLYPFALPYRRKPPYAGLRPNRAHPQLKGCVAWYTFREGAGLKFRDEFQKATMNRTDGLWAVSAGRKAAELNSTQGACGVLSGVSADYPQLETIDSSLSVWLNTSNAGAGYRGIVVKNQNYGIYLVSGVFNYFDWNAGVGRSSGVNVADGLWYHLAVTLNSSASQGSFYINGQFISTQAWAISNNDNRLSIGAGNEDATLQQITADMEDARVYNRVLTSAEIKDIYENPWAPFERSLWSVPQINIPSITDFGDEAHLQGEVSITITGINLGSVEGEVWIYQNSNRTGIADQLTVNSWSDTSISVDIPITTTNPSGTLYLFVKNSSAVWSLTGFEFTLVEDCSSTINGYFVRCLERVSAFNENTAFAVEDTEPGSYHAIGRQIVQYFDARDATLTGDWDFQGAATFASSITVTGKAHINQSDTSGAIPPLHLEQDDVSEEFIRFTGTSAAATLTQSLVDNQDLSTPGSITGTVTLVGWAKINVQDEGNQVTDGVYYTPFFTLDS